MGLACMYVHVRACVCVLTFMHVYVRVCTCVQVRACVPRNNGKLPGDFDSWAEMSVRVWKGGFMVETL